MLGWQGGGVVECNSTVLGQQGGSGAESSGMVEGWGSSLIACWSGSALRVGQAVHCVLVRQRIACWSGSALRGCGCGC